MEREIENLERNRKTPLETPWKAILTSTPVLALIVSGVRSSNCHQYDYYAHAISFLYQQQPVYLYKSYKYYEFIVDRRILQFHFIRFPTDLPE